MTWLSELPYSHDSTRLFEIIAGHPWAMFLDSGYPNIATERWDILTADPYVTIVTQQGSTTVCDNTGETVTTTDPFTVLRHTLGKPAAPLPNIPFAGGALGWFSYDLARHIETLPVQATDIDRLPELAIGIFDWAVVVDHKEQRTWLASNNSQPTMTHERWTQLRQLWQAVADTATSDTAIPQYFQVLNPPSSNMSRAQYLAAFHRIQQYIFNGDCYQVNFAQCFSAPTEGDPWPAYKVLRTINPAPCGAYLKIPYATVLSASPERFLRLYHRQVHTQPIKGTRPRGSTEAEDAQLAMQLTHSIKDRAENLMIVDLLRNDLGRVCIPGSIKVPQLFSLERYATVQHLVSTITGQLAQNQDAVALLKACFPGGSVTGAPKIRAMAIIEELEPQRRGVYCGSIGYVGFDGAMDTNIAIRTLVHHNDLLRFWVGGGIVYDSTAEQEYQETMDKAAALLQLLQMFLRDPIG